MANQHQKKDFGSDSKIEMASQRDGSILLVVRNNGNCLDVDGRWEVEPSPSNRDQGFLARCRFQTVMDAYATWKSREQEVQPREILRTSEG
jgi:hypothetical protein